MRQEAKAEEDRACTARREVDDELILRFNDAGATRLALGNGMHIDKIDSKTSAWSSFGVEALRQFLVGGGHITEEEWYLGVSYTPKVDGNRLKGWRKYGEEEVGQLIDGARISATGRPVLRGPSLEEMQHGEL